MKLELIEVSCKPANRRTKPSKYRDILVEFLKSNKDICQIKTDVPLNCLHSNLMYQIKYHDLKVKITQRKPYIYLERADSDAITTEGV